MRNRLIGIGLSLLVAFLALRFLETDNGGGITMPVGISPDSSMGAGELPRASLAPVSKVDTKLARKEVEGVPESAEPSGPSEGTRQVLVVDSLSGKILPGAIVTYLEEFDPDPLDEMRLFRTIIFDVFDPEWYMNALGDEILSEPPSLHFVADEFGHVEIPVHPGLVMGRRGDLWNLELLPHDVGEPFTLGLLPDTSLTLRLLDSTGAPAAGVWVTSKQRPELGPDFRGNWQADEVTGEVTYPHLGRRLVELRGGLAGPGPASSVHSMHFETPLAEPLVYTPDVLDFPTERVDLILPPTGGLAFQLVHPGGEPYTEDHAWARLSRVDPVTGLPLSDSVFEEGLTTMVNPQGRGEYPWLGLGFEFELRVGFGRGESLFRKRLKGPSYPGEQVTTELAIEINYPVLAFRALDADGAIMAETSGQIELTRPGVRGSYNVDFSTNEEGEARAHLDYAPFLKSSEPIRMTMNAYYPNQRCILELQELKRTGVTDLGDRRFTAQKLMLSGKVLDEGGRPIPNATVTFRAAAHSLTVTSDPGRLVAHSDNMGDFRLLAFAASERLDLHCRASGFLEERQRGLSVGTLDASIVLKRGGELSGSLELEENLDGRLLSVSIVCPKAPEQNREVVVLRHGRFSVSGLKRGIYDLTIGYDESDPGRMESGSAKLARVSALVVPASGVCVDPRLQGIRLPRLFSYHYSFVDERGSQIEWGDLSVRASGSGLPFEQGRQFDMQHGPCEFLSTESRMDAVLSAGHQVAPEMLGLDGGGEFIVEPLPMIEVQFTGGLPELPEGLGWLCTFEMADYNLHEWCLDEALLLSEGRIGWWLPGNRPCEIQLYLMAYTSKGLLRRRVQLEPWHLKLDGSPHQSYDLAWGDRDLTARIQELLGGASGARGE